MLYGNSGFSRGMDTALEISALDSTQQAQSAHLFSLTMIATTGNRNVNDAIKGLDETQDKIAEDTCKKSDEQKQKLLAARERQLARAEALADRIAAV